MNLDSKTKVVNSAAKKFASGGKGSLPNGTAGPQMPGQSAQMGRSKAKFASGGSNRMLPNGTSTVAKPA